MHNGLNKRVGHVFLRGRSFLLSTVPGAAPTALVSYFFHTHGFAVG
jgi:hypothetical protein